MDLTFRHFFASFLLSAEDKLYLEKKNATQRQKDSISIR